MARLLRAQKPHELWWELTEPTLILFNIFACKVSSILAVPLVADDKVLERKQSPQASVQKKSCSKLCRYNVQPPTPRMVVEMYQFLGEPLKNYIYYIISPLIFSSFLYVTLRKPCLSCSSFFGFCKHANVELCKYLKIFSFFTFF